MRFLLVSLILLFPTVAWAQDEKKKPEVAPMELSQLAKARYDAAEKAYDAYYKKIVRNGLGTGDTPYQLSRRLIEAEIDMDKRRETQAYEAHLRRMIEWEKYEKSRGGPDAPWVLVLQSFRIEAQYWVAKSKAKNAK